MSRHCFGGAKQELGWETLWKRTKVCYGYTEANGFPHMLISFPHEDLLNVLKIEPSNQSAQEELKKVAGLIEKEKSKVCFHFS